MPNVPENNPELLVPVVEGEITRYMTAHEQGDLRSLPVIENRVLEICGGGRVMSTLLGIASRYRAERTVIAAALESKSQVLDSLLAAPRRIARVLGLVYEDDALGEPVAWAILQGPPCQAVRFHSDLAPHDVCEDHPEDPVWVWLAESAEGSVVLGKIQAPPLLQVGAEKEMVFEGLAETEGETDVP